MEIIFAVIALSYVVSVIASYAAGKSRGENPYARVLREEDLQEARRRLSTNPLCSPARAPLTEAQPRLFPDGRLRCRYATPYGILNMGVKTYEFYQSSPEYFNHIAEIMYNEGRSYHPAVGGNITLMSVVKEVNEYNVTEDFSTISKGNVTYSRHA